MTQNHSTPLLPVLTGPLRVVNNLLREAGWAVWVGAQPAQGNPATELPDLIATHKTEGTLLVYLARNCRSMISPAEQPVRQVYASGYSDFKMLLETGRPEPSNTQTLF